MTALVHSGNLGRWFEELCRIKHKRLQEITAPNGEQLKPSILKHKGGVYAFWWTGPLEMLHTRNWDLHVPGPGGRLVELQIDDEWLGLGAGCPIPLYVGKNADSIAKRVGQHLRLSQVRMLPTGCGPTKKELPTTSCQLRAGIEHFFPDEEDTRTLMLENVGLSYVILDGDGFAANRFYLEDLAIGLMRPPINVDVER
jgi:hypothetical protein